MDYKKLEQMISSYNEMVNSLNSAMDKAVADNGIEGAPYDEFEFVKATDENSNHLPYLYLRFVYLPYHVQPDTVDEQ